MNPSVKVAYDQAQYDWNNVVLRLPIVKWWRGELPFLVPSLIRICVSSRAERSRCMESSYWVAHCLGGHDEREDTYT